MDERPDQRPRALLHANRLGYVFDEFAYQTVRCHASGRLFEPTSLMSSLLGPASTLSPFTSGAVTGTSLPETPSYCRMSAARASCDRLL